MTATEAWKRLPKWLRLWLTATDRRVNALLGGSPDETLSATLARRRHNDPIAGMACAVLDRIDPEHCERALRNPYGEQP